MVLLSVALAHAEEAAPERLKGFHFGLGGGVYWSSSTVTTTDGTVQAVSGGTTTASMRLRLNERVALEPSVRLGHLTGDSFTNFATDRKHEGTERLDYYTLALGVRARIAAVDRVDLVALANAGHSRSWYTEEPEEPEQGERQTSFSHSTSASVGIGIEYWLAHRVSVGADLQTQVLSWEVSRAEPSEDEYQVFAARFSPSGDLTVHFYF